MSSLISRLHTRLSQTTAAMSTNSTAFGLHCADGHCHTQSCQQTLVAVECHVQTDKKQAYKLANMYVNNGPFKMLSIVVFV